jgi:hypothetical protein
LLCLGQASGNAAVTKFSRRPTPSEQREVGDQLAHQGGRVPGLAKG